MRKKKLVRDKPELAYEHKPVATALFIITALLLALVFLFFGS